MNSTQSLTSFTRTSLTNSNTVSYPDAQATTDMNFWYRDMIVAIVTKVQDFFWTYGSSDSVIGQSEYTIEQFTFPDASTRDIVSVDWVSVKYATDSDYYKLKKTGYESLDLDLSKYANWGGEPFYFVRDNSVFVFPTPTNVVTGWVKISGNYRPQDLTLSTDESQIKTSRLFNMLLSYYQAYMYWTASLRDDKASQYKAQYEIWKQQMVDTLSSRDREIIWYEF